MFESTLPRLEIKDDDNTVGKEDNSSLSREERV